MLDRFKRLGLLSKCMIICAIVGGIVVMVLYGAIAATGGISWPL